MRGWIVYVSHKPTSITYIYYISMLKKGIVMQSEMNNSANKVLISLLVPRLLAYLGKFNRGSIVQELKSCEIGTTTFHHSLQFALLPATLRHLESIFDDINWPYFNTLNSIHSTCATPSLCKNPASILLGTMKTTIHRLLTRRNRDFLDFSPQPGGNS